MLGLTGWESGAHASSRVLVRRTLSPGSLSQALAGSTEYLCSPCSALLVAIMRCSSFASLPAYCVDTTNPDSYYLTAWGALLASPLSVPPLANNRRAFLRLVQNGPYWGEPPFASLLPSLVWCLPPRTARRPFPFGFWPCHLGRRPIFTDKTRAVAPSLHSLLLPFLSFFPSLLSRRDPHLLSVHPSFQFCITEIHSCSFSHQHFFITGALSIFPIRATELSQ